MVPKSSVLSVLALAFSYVVSSFELNYPAVFNFGDSNSDTGGLAAGIGFQLGKPYGQTFFHEPSGRFCDGRLIIDFLMEDAMELPFLNPYLDSVGAPSFHRGCNFATAGSTILLESGSYEKEVSPFALEIQLAQFIRFKTRVLELLAKDHKLGGFLPREDYFEQGLYTFDVGQNDLDLALSSKTEEETNALIPAILSVFQEVLEILYKAGARNFWIHNTGPLGCLPSIIATHGNDPSKLDALGCVSSHNNAAEKFNIGLNGLCTKFKAQFPDVHVTYADIFSAKLNLIANYSQYGFKEPLAACCGFGGPALNYDNRISCGETKKLNGSEVTASACKNTSESINWDGAHYTEAANRYVTAQILMTGIKTKSSQ